MLRVYATNVLLMVTFFVSSMGFAYGSNGKFTTEEILKLGKVASPDSKRTQYRNPESQQQTQQQPQSQQYAYPSPSNSAPSKPLSQPDLANPPASTRNGNSPGPSDRSHSSTSKAPSSHEKSNADHKNSGAKHHSNTAYWEAFRALQFFNQMMTMAGHNPLDDFRRNQLQAAKAQVEVKMEKLHAEVKKGNLSAAEFTAAKMELAQHVDVNAPLREYLNADKLGAGNQNGGETIGMQESKPSSESASLAQSDTTSQAGALSNSQVVVLGGANGSTPKALTAGAGVDSSKTNLSTGERGSEPKLAAMDTMLAGARGSSISNSEKSILIASEKTVESAEKLQSSTSELVNKPEGKHDEEKRSAELDPVMQELELRGAQRLESVANVVAEIKPDELIGEIRFDSDPSLHVTGNLRGEKLVMGDFGKGVVAVKIKKTSSGYTIERLTRKQLYFDYVKSIGLWSLVFLPAMAAAFAYGRRPRRGRELLKQAPESQAA